MHYILPAADAAQELQEAMHAYLKQYDNPLVKKNAKQLTEVNQHSLLAKQAAYLSARLQHYKFCLAHLARQIRDPARAREPAKQALIESLWDQMDRYPHYNLQQFSTFTLPNLEQWVAELKHVVERAEKHIRVPETVKRRLGMVSLEQEAPVFTLDDCRRIVEAMMLDELTLQLKWLSKSDGEYQTHLQRVMLSIFPDWDALDPEQASNLPKEHLEIWREQAVKCSTDIYRKVLEPLTLRIARWVGTAIPESTWDMWYVRPLGRDLVLEQGEDYRVWDWERRMSSGEWSRDEPKLFLDPQHDEVAAQTNEDVQTTQAKVAATEALGLSVELFPNTLGSRAAPELIHAGQKTKSRKNRA